MKKLFSTLAAAALVLSLTGCSGSAGNGEEGAVRKLIDTFWTNIESGDIAGAEALCDGDSASKVAELAQSVESATAMFGNDLSEDSKKKVEEFTKTMFSVTFNGYTIDSVEKSSDTEYKVSTTVKLLDSASMDEFYESEDYEKFMDDLYTQMTDYSADHDDDEVYTFMMNSILDFMSESFSKLKETGKYTDENASFVVSKKENDWKITKFVTQPGSSDSE